MGSMFPSVCCAPSSGMPVCLPYSALLAYRSDVDEPDVLGVLLDEVTAGLDVFAHELREHLVGDGGVLLEVVALLADVGAVQRRLRDVDAPLRDQLLQLTEEERQQERAYVTAIYIRVSHDNHLVVPDLLALEVLADAGADGGDERLDLLVLEHAVDAGALDVEDLPPDRQDRLDAWVARPLGAAPGAVAFDDEQLRLARVVRRAVGELARHRRGVEERLAAGEVARLAGGDARPH